MGAENCAHDASSEKSGKTDGSSILLVKEYPKYVVSLNDMDAGIENGIKIVHLQDFLLAEMW